MIEAEWLFVSHPNPVMHPSCSIFRVRLSASLVRLAILAPFALPSFVFTLSAGDSQVISRETRTGIGEPQSISAIEVQFKDHTITYERIPTPPLLPAPEMKAAAAPQALPEISFGLAETDQADNQADDQEYHFLFLSCLEIEGTGLTEVRWGWGDEQVVFWSTIDFQHFEGTADLISPKAFYSFLTFHSQMPADEVRPHNAVVLAKGWPQSNLLSPPRIQSLRSGTGRARFTTLPPATSATSATSATGSTGSTGSNHPPEAERIIGDIHRLYDANRDKLAQAFEQRQIEIAAHEKWIADNPPKPQDSHIRFFPIRSGGRDFTATAAKPEEEVR